MANPEHEAKLREGVEAWNQWRKVYRGVKPDLSEANLEGFYLRGVYLLEANLNKINLEGADLRRAILLGADLSGANLEGADLREADLYGVNLSKANLKDTDLRYTCLSNAKFTEADLRSSNLSRADLRNADLSKADLRRANLWGADLRNSELKNADLREANLNGAYFTEANFNAADLTKALVDYWRIGSPARNAIGDISLSDWLYTKKSRHFFDVSLLHPKRLAKGSTSAVNIQIYLPEFRSKVESGIQQKQSNNDSDAPLHEKIYSSALIPELTVSINLSSPSLLFSSEVRKKLVSGINSIACSIAPSNECSPGKQTAILSIKDVGTGNELESYDFSLIVDDYAFDHISKPTVSYVSSAVAGVGSIALFVLTLLQQVDATLGVPAGTAAGAFAAFYGTLPTRLYSRQSSSTPLKKP